MNIELRKLMDKKRLLDEEIDTLEKNILCAYNNNEFDKVETLKESYEKKKSNRAELRQMMLPLIIKPGYMWDK